jgi:hypothetical protein
MGRFYFLNTDRTNLPRSPHDIWFQKGLAVTAASDRYDDLLTQLRVGDTIFMYVNGEGLLGVGRVAKKWDGTEHYPPLVYRDSGISEYRVRVQWALDLRSRPISPAQLRELGASPPPRAIQRVDSRVGGRLLSYLKGSIAPSTWPWPAVPFPPEESRQGWVYSLSNSENSAWGSPEGLFEAIEATGDDSVLQIESEVWGKLLRRGCDPQPGDGFAFYHSRRALFPKSDAHKRRPRISLVGTLQQIKRDGLNVKQIRVNIDPDVMNALRANPLVRDKRTEDFFRRCGLRPGPVASFYPVFAEDWQLLVSWVAERLPDGKPPKRIVLPTDLVDLPIEELHPSSAFPEGAIHKIYVNAYERNPTARRLCLKHYGMVCSLCGFRFAQFYGHIGEGFMEVHHIVALSDVGKKYKVDPIRDLRPVCSNCHSIIHRRRPAFTMDEVRAFLKRTSPLGPQGHSG